MKKVGSRAEVMHGTAKETSGKLTKKNLKFVKGRIVSKKASTAAKKKLKDSPFKKFVDNAKKQKGKSLKLSPKKSTTSYKKIMA